MTKGQVWRPVGVILAESRVAVAAGPAAREAQRPGGQRATAKARGRNPDVRGLLLGAPKPQDTFKTNSSRKVKAGVVELASNTVTQKVGVASSRSSSTTESLRPVWARSGAVSFLPKYESTHWLFQPFCRGHWVSWLST